ncbi:MAG: Asp-tRNA(Asn)/Glu-tRNA(Gln) amidotransferase subunit GatC [Clostridia bacterium]|nr:Asp-tRNA(Asn)/Glu-tRNA(Gln) amidotransferase subunit GatC [Clostridia bacterium]
MISREEVLNIANLSKLYLDESEIEDARQAMDGMINFADEINQIDVNLENLPEFNSTCNAFHEDEIKQSYPQEKILENVDGGKDGYFHIKKFN